eukprot:CAMPEP_0113846186 /NCGR_PEP_ID=MMETSP0372-20130328/1170_1 /TAXON_ID=340204 /ORGANISM="Lankesteria abbotti" /LENGTH=323 /DNA_ID=CAMNT_0000815307 /DNA_START=47 /DNA_END=1018 /DNA_ORIENTATION=- /assembly_acc=CAM_ASM_000359
MAALGCHDGVGGQALITVGDGNSECDEYGDSRNGDGGKSEVKSVDGNGECDEYGVSGNGDGGNGVDGKSEVKSVDGKSEVKSVDGKSEVKNVDGKSVDGGKSEVKSVDGNGECEEYGVSGNGVDGKSEVKSGVKSVDGKSEVKSVDGKSEVKSVDGDTKTIEEPAGPWEHDKMPPMTDRAIVNYCPACGMPPSYCEFFTPSGLKCSAVDNSKDTAKALPLEEPEGSKSKKASKKAKVTIQSVPRAKRKAVTVIVGLEHFDVNLDAAAKVFKKDFACGASVSRGTPGKPDHVEIQGDFTDAVPHLLLRRFSSLAPEVLTVLPPK